MLSDCYLLLLAPHGRSPSRDEVASGGCASVCASAKVGSGFALARRGSSSLALRSLFLPCSHLLPPPVRRPVPTSPIHKPCSHTLFTPMTYSLAHAAAVHTPLTCSHSLVTCSHLLFSSSVHISSRPLFTPPHPSQSAPIHTPPTYSCSTSSPTSSLIPSSPRSRHDLKWEIEIPSRIRLGLRIPARI